MSEGKRRPASRPPPWPTGRPGHTGWQRLCLPPQTESLGPKLCRPYRFDREVYQMLSNPTKPAPAPLTTDEALATLAHELRDPLNTILLALELSSCDGDPAAQRALMMAGHQARRAVRIVDDLFDF